MATASDAAVHVRRADEDDLEAVVALASAALGWRDGEPNETLFRWKHLDNPFGPSPMWVAEVAGRLAGFRTFLRWGWRWPDGRVARAVRAVDTATHPDFQGRGIFTKLTLGALDELADEGVRFVFNTPNEQSRPGYLKMGWQVVGRVPVGVRLAGPGALARTVRARVPAGKWSHPTTVGEPAGEVLGGSGVDGLLAALPADGGLTTDRTPAFLAWRYRLDELHYRVLRAGSAVEDGVVVFRLRSRGPATEAVVADVLLPPGTAEAPLLREVQRATGADYLIRVQPELVRRGGSVRLPGQGPVLTWRGVAEEAMPPLERWSLCLGDVELF